MRKEGFLKIVCHIIPWVFAGWTGVGLIMVIAAILGANFTFKEGMMVGLSFLLFWWGLTIIPILLSSVVFAAILLINRYAQRIEPERG